MISIEILFFLEKPMKMLNRTEICILLLEDLDTDIPHTLHPNLRKLLKSIKLPSLKYLPLSVLNKKKIDKEAILTDSWSYLTEEKVQDVIPNLNQILIPAFNKVIDTCYFEITHWRSMLKKAAGMIVYKLLKLFSMRMRFLTKTECSVKVGRPPVFFYFQLHCLLL